VRKTGLAWLWIAVVVLVIDQVTKSLALKHLTLYIERPVTRFLNFTLGYNTGSAFGFLNNSSGFEVPVFGLIALIVTVFIGVWLYRLSSKEWWTNIALSLIVGGALGNLWDRISYGHVVDFIKFHWSRWYFATFNIADSAICIGAFMLVFEALRSSSKK
jgi:lipoprotein signal peptidase